MRELSLSGGKTALVDDEDYLRVSQFSWISYFRSSTWYVSRSKRVKGRQTSIYLHRFILAAPKGSIVDHVNGNGLDNRRANLRYCTQSQNQGNQHCLRAGYRGVSWHKGAQKWTARISVFKNTINLGVFATAERAALAYDVAANSHFGEFAKPNLPGVTVDPEFQRGISMLMNSFARQQAQRGGAE